jgi:dTDP-4-amino-4,6-dideoxygalactose transaminase
VIPYGKQDINQTDIESVINVLQSDFLTQGPQVPLFHTLAIEQQDKVVAILRKVLQ